jgi:hypothetical protein
VCLACDVTSKGPKKIFSAFVDAAMAKCLISWKTGVGRDARRIADSMPRRVEKLELVWITSCLAPAVEMSAMLLGERGAIMSVVDSIWVCLSLLPAKLSLVYLRLRAGLMRSEDAS